MRQLLDKLADEIEISASSGSPTRQQDCASAGGHQAADRLKDFAAGLTGAAPAGSAARRAFESLLGGSGIAGQHDSFGTAMREREPFGERVVGFTFRPLQRRPAVAPIA